MKSATRRIVCIWVVVLATVSPNISGFAQTATGKVQLYFFTNPSCGPCRQVEPELETLFREGFSIMKIDTSRHPDWTRRFQVDRTPTVVLMSGDRIVARHSGFVDAATLRGWFRQVEDHSPTSAQAKVVQPRSPTTDGAASVEAEPRSADTTTGTATPQNEAESLALQATIRLRVDDPRGSSFATGTVVHCHAGDALVVTCGHVFRDSQGQGTISAEYGFSQGTIKKASGELLYYDADARDIGLVAITIADPIQPVPIADVNFPVQKGDQIFSIGCDHGSAPTIRRSRIKNQAKYDGVDKYDIYGRPVDGRSGGGMFTAGGQLIGVCNAAVVDADEGVYVALDTIHWQLAAANLQHLFNQESSVVSVPTSPQPEQLLASETPSALQSDSRLARVPVRDRFSEERIPVEAAGNAVDAMDVSRSSPQARTPVAVDTFAGNDELIVVLRSKDASGQMQTWTIDQPNPRLVAQLKQMGGVPADPRSAENRIARLRREMPDLPNQSGSNQNRDQFRAQSPR